MKFHLVGTVHWSVGSCHDDRTLTVNEEKEEADVEAAITWARSRVAELEREHSWRTDFGMQIKLRKVEPVWETRYRDEEKARPAIPAREARPAGFEEKRLS